MKRASREARPYMKQHRRLVIVDGRRWRRSWRRGAVPPPFSVFRGQELKPIVADARAVLKRLSGERR